MFVLIGILLAFLLTSCTSPKLSDPISIDQEAAERVNKGDMNGAMEFFADNAIVSDFTTWLIGAQEIRE